MEAKQRKQKKQSGCLSGCLTAFIGICILSFVVVFFVERFTEENRYLKELSAEQEKAIVSILKEVGVDEIVRIAADELLNNMNEEGEKGYRVESRVKGEQLNVILYLKEAQVNSIRWADMDFYGDGQVLGSLKDYVLSISEKSDIQINCQKGVKAILKAPSTAKFPSLSEWVFDVNAERITVKSYVDSQNSFGAMIRSEFQVVFTRQGVTESFIFDGQELIPQS